MSSPAINRLASAGVVGEKESQRLPRQLVSVDGDDPVRQRVYYRCMDREQGSNLQTLTNIVAAGDGCSRHCVLTFIFQGGLQRSTRSRPGLLPRASLFFDGSGLLHATIRLLAISKPRLASLVLLVEIDAGGAALQVRIAAGGNRTCSGEIRFG